LSVLHKFGSLNSVREKLHFGSQESSHDGGDKFRDYRTQMRRQRLKTFGERAALRKNRKGGGVETVERDSWVKIDLGRTVGAGHPTQ